MGEDFYPYSGIPQAGGVTPGKQSDSQDVFDPHPTKRLHILIRPCMVSRQNDDKAIVGHSVIATQSFWVIDGIEDHLNHYTQEWEQFTAENAKGQHHLEYICLMHSGIVDYASALILYLPYPIVVKMLRRFENGSFWFQDKMVSINEGLIDHITGLPIHGDKIDLREKARQMGREMIIQKLYPCCEEADVWKKSNGFIINQITNEGAKCTTRIMAKRLIGVEANTYLSHQWMFGCPFPMPSLLVVICMDALGLPKWINPDEQPRLNSYSHLKRKRGDTKHRVANAYLERFYLMLRRLNDGPERTKKLPEYIKKQWREVQEKASTSGKEKIKSSAKGSRSLKRKHSQLELTYRGHSSHDKEQKTSREERKRQKIDEAKEKELQKGNQKDPNVSQEVIITTPLSVNPIGTMQELITRVEELELELILQAHQAQAEKDSLNQNVNLLLQEIGELGVLPSIDQAPMATEVLPNLCPHVVSNGCF
eukprot:Gb_40144 [translate_table: standard]